tara:strand:- start:1105 stop:1314 length:210 start_codon:yes stop_codon:yes gene_type:complete
MDDEPSLLVDETFQVKGDEDGHVDLIPYPHYSSNRHIFLTSTDVLTILDPSAAVAEAYNETIAKQQSKK